MPHTPEADAWQTWFDRHGAALALFARQFLSSPDEADDAVQNGFIKFWNARLRLKSLQNPTAYLYACVRTAALDLRRKLRTRQHHEQTAASASPLFILPSTHIESAERRQLLEAALHKLPEEQREILILKIWSPPPGLTFAQIAAAVGIPANTAASRYRYALQRLATLLSPEVTRDTTR